MYAQSFDYYRARSVADAHQLLAAHPGAKLLAGGHSLVPLLKLRLAAPSALVDIGRDPRAARHLAAGGRDPHRRAHDACRAGRVGGSAPGRAGAGRGGGTGRRSRGQESRDDRRQCRARGSGIRSADRARGARCARALRPDRAASARFRRIEFFTGIMTTALAEDEILLAIHVPASSRGQGSAYEKFSHPASRYAVIGVAALGRGRERHRAARRALPWAGCCPARVAPAAVGGRADGQGDHRRRRSPRRPRQVAADLGNDVTRRHLRVGGIPPCGRARVHQASAAPTPRRAPR